VKFKICVAYDYNLVSDFRLVVESPAMKEDGVYTLTASNSIGETTTTANLKVNGNYFVVFQNMNIVFT
jgi:hypothetical protein